MYRDTRKHRPIRSTILGAIAAFAITQSSAQTAPPAPQSDLAKHSAACMNEKHAASAETAIAACNAVIQSTTRNLANAYYFRGEAYALKRDFDRAIQDFTQALALAPNDADVLVSRAAAHEAKKETDRALADYNLAAKANPKAAQVFMNRGAFHQRKGDYARAAADYGEVTRLQPDNAYAWSARCWVRAVGGLELRQALADCDRALKIKPNTADILDSRGVVHFKLRQYDQALRDFDAALKIEPKLASSLYARGLARLRTGDRGRAMDDIKAAEAIQPDIAQDLARFGMR